MFKISKTLKDTSECLYNFIKPIFHFCRNIVDPNVFASSNSAPTYKLNSAAVFKLIDFVLRVADGNELHVISIVLEPFLRSSNTIHDVNIAARLLNYWEIMVYDHATNVITIAMFLKNRIIPTLNEPAFKINGTILEILRTSLSTCHSNPLALENVFTHKEGEAIVKFLIENPIKNCADIIDACTSLLIRIDPRPCCKMNIDAIFPVLEYKELEVVADMLPTLISWIAQNSSEKVSYEELLKMLAHPTIKKICESNKQRKQFFNQILGRIEILTDPQKHINRNYLRDNEFHVTLDSVFAPIVVSVLLLFVNIMKERNKHAPKIFNWIRIRCERSKIDCIYFHNQAVHTILLNHYEDLLKDTSVRKILKCILSTRITKNDLKQVLIRLKNDTQNRQYWLSLLHYIVSSAKSGDARHSIIFGNGLLPMRRMYTNRDNSSLNDEPQTKKSQRVNANFEPVQQEFTISFWIRMAQEFTVRRNKYDFLHVISAKFSQNTLTVHLQSTGKLIIRTFNHIDESSITLYHDAPYIGSEWTNVILSAESHRQLTIILNQQAFVQKVSFEDKFFTASPVEVFFGSGISDHHYDNTVSYQLSSFMIFKCAVTRKEASILHFLGPVRFNFLGKTELEYYEYIELRYNAHFKDESSLLELSKFQEAMKKFTENYLVGWAARCPNCIMCRDMKKIRTVDLSLENMELYHLNTPSVLHVLLSIGGIYHFMYLLGFIVENHYDTKMQSMSLSILLKSALKNSLLFTELVDMSGYDMILRLLTHIKAITSIEALKAIILFASGSTDEEEVIFDDDTTNWTLLNSHRLAFVYRTVWANLIIKNYIWTRSSVAADFKASVYSYMLSEASPFCDFNRAVFFTTSLCQVFLTDIQDSMLSGITVSKFLFEITSKYIENMTFETDYAKLYYRMLISLGLKVIHEKAASRKSSKKSEENTLHLPFIRKISDDSTSTNFLEAFSKAFYCRVQLYNEDETIRLLELLKDKSFIALVMIRGSFNDLHALKMILHLLKCAFTKIRPNNFSRSDLRCIMTLISSQFKSFKLSQEIFEYCREYCDYDLNWTCDTLPIFYGLWYGEIEVINTYRSTVEHIFQVFDQFNEEQRQICIQTGFLQAMLKSRCLNESFEYNEINSGFAYGVALVFFCSTDHYYTFNWYVAAISQIYVHKSLDKSTKNSDRYVVVGIRTVVEAVEAVLDLVMEILFEIHPSHREQMGDSSTLNKSHLLKKFLERALNDFPNHIDWYCHNIANFFKLSSDALIANDQQVKNINKEVLLMENTMLQLTRSIIILSSAVSEFISSDVIPSFQMDLMRLLKEQEDIINSSFKSMFYLFKSCHQSSTRISMIRLFSEEIPDLHYYFGYLRLHSNDEHCETIKAYLSDLLHDSSYPDLASHLDKINAAIDLLPSSGIKWVSGTARSVSSLSRHNQENCRRGVNIAQIEKDFKRLIQKDILAISQHSNDAINYYKEGLSAAKSIQNAQGNVSTEYKRERLQICYEAVKSWRSLVSHLTHDCALWHEKESYGQFWRLDQMASATGERRRLKRCRIGDFEDRFLLPESRWRLEPEKNDLPLIYLRQMDGGINEYIDKAFIQSLQDSNSVEFYRKCSKIRAEYNVEGVIYIHMNNVNFIGLSVNHERGTIYHQLDDGVSDSYITIRSNEIQQMFRRRYILSNVAVEIFLTSGDSHMFMFEKMEDREMFWKHVMNIQPPSYKNPLSIDQVARQWIDGHLSNFEYLRLLNRYAGRSFNDLLQYPVFPHILSKYTLDKIELDDPKIYRNLNRPIAIQNPEREEKFKMNYTSLQQKGNNRISAFIRPGPYHYPSVYSNMTVVLQYLIRVLPYTRQFIEYQDGEFDVPDRCFRSIKSTYLVLTGESISDFRELIPEFFYFHEFLQNRLGFDYGRRQNGKQIGDVELPTWCNQNARLFVMIHRQALESDHVTRSLNGWIDLIFGHNQQGRNAVRTMNLYHPACYYGFDFGDCPTKGIFEVLMEIAKSYGQIPLQLFHSPHMAHKPIEQNLRYRFPSESIHHNVLALNWGDYVGSLKHANGITIQNLSTSQKPLIAFCCWNNQVFGLANTYLHMTFSLGGKELKDPLTISYDEKSSLLAFSVLNKPTTYRCLLPTNLGMATTCTSFDDTIFIGYTCGAIATYSVHKNGLAAGPLRHRFPFIAHDAPVTSLTVCQSFSLMISGDAMGRIALWDMARMEYIQSTTLEGRKVSKIAISDTTGDFAVVSYYNDRDLLDYEEWRLDMFTCNMDKIASLDPYRVFKKKSECELRAITFTNAPEGTSVNCLVGGFSDGTLRFWSTFDLTLLRVANCLEGRGAITAIAFNSGRDRMFVSNDKCEVFSVVNKQYT
ncbi:hypothetical protein ACOME3_009086 [Neoechinorhynchus agilis]